MLYIILLIWLPLSVAVGLLANRYNRNGLAWFLFALLISPLLGFVFVLACGPLGARPIGPPQPRPALAAVTAQERQRPELETDGGLLGSLILGVGVLLITLMAVWMG